VGDILVAQGDLPEALNAFRRSPTIRQRLVDADPANAGWQHDLAILFLKVGDVVVAQGHLSEALKSFRDSTAIAQRLANTDPANAGWQRHLSVSYEKVGSVLAAQGNLPEALKSFRASLEIRQRLADADPGNAGWQGDLVVSLYKLAVSGKHRRQIYARRSRSWNASTELARCRPTESPGSKRFEVRFPIRTNNPSTTSHGASGLYSEMGSPAGPSAALHA